MPQFVHSLAMLVSTS